jgi:hypothetical protein
MLAFSISIDSPNPSHSQMTQPSQAVVEPNQQILRGSPNALNLSPSQTLVEAIGKGKTQVRTAQINEANPPTNPMRN